MLQKFSELVLDLYRNCREVPIEAFQDCALQFIQPVIEFDSAVWLTSTIHQNSDSATFHTRHFYRQPSQLLSDWMKCKGATVFPRKLFASPGRTFACTPFIEMEPDVAAHCRNYGIEQILTTAKVEPVAGIHEMISLYRSDIMRPFSEEERQFQQNLVPHLSEAWRICRIKHLSSLGQPACALDAYAAGADKEGVLHIVDPGFMQLLLEEWPGWHGPQLPAKLLEACRRNEERFVGRRAVFLFYYLGDHMLLRGRSKLSIDSLSQREREIAEYYIDGNSYKEIAQMLNLSPATIRNHLSTVYGKLGIDNKAALATAMSK